MSHQCSVFEEALRLQAMGLSIVPANKRKKPALRTWKQYQKKPAEEQQVRDWFSGRDDLGLGIVMGFGDVYVRDFDDFRASAKWEASHRELAQSLPTVKTSRGRHFYARHPDVRTRTFADGELRGRGAIVMAPPSQHSTGVFYEYLVPIKSLGLIPVLDPEEAGFTESLAEGQLDRITDSVVSVESVVSVQGLIQRSLPPGFGTRNRRLFDFARSLRSHPEWATVPVAALRPHVEEWHRRALPNIRTKEFDATWSDFIAADSNIDLARCTDSVIEAMKRADAAPLPPEAIRYEIPLVRRLAALCKELAACS